MKVTYTTPQGYSWKLCDDLLMQDHAVIGGTTGSGKSTFLHSLIYSALIHSPVKVQFILIDLKGVELMDYEHLPHTLIYADEPDRAIYALEQADRIMRDRVESMKKNRQRLYDGSDIYVIIDEMAVLMQNTKAKTLPLLANIMRLGRAAKVHVISATQNPSRSSGGGLPSIVSQNVTSSICLRTRSAIESRQICGLPDGASLPRYGEGIYWNPEGIRHVTIPQTPPEDLAERINFWMNQKPRREVAECRSQSGFFTRLARVFA